jgi:hypothetical protein
MWTYCHGTRAMAVESGAAYHKIERLLVYGPVTWHNWWHLLDFSVSKIFLLQGHWLVSSRTGLLFQGHLPFQSYIPEESGSSQIQNNNLCVVTSSHALHQKGDFLWYSTYWALTCLHYHHNSYSFKIRWWSFWWHGSSGSHMVGRCSKQLW